jgi:eukaryotic-like serine/threonine-protein kinase
MSPEVRPQPSVSDRSPKSIGSYSIRARIGRGAMGVVYRAIDERTKSVVALKAMSSDLDGDPETRERFFREANVAGKLRHRNIVTVLDSGEDGGRLFIAMELLSGATLNELIKESTYTDIEDRIDAMIQVCQGLQIAHAAGVFHRDLKPANLFVCDDRRVKILDFGVARLVGSNMTVTGNIIGTPDFMSPEQVRGQDVDERSDIFSAGSVFYLLLTGRKPFAASDLPAVLNKVVRAQALPIREDEAPEAIAAVIRKSMAKDPEARQQTIPQLAAELMAASSSVEAATRARAVEVRHLSEQAIALTKRRTQIAAELEMPDGDDLWLALRDQFPILRRGPAVLGVYPLRSGVIQALETAVKGVIDSLTPIVSALGEASAAWRCGEKFMAEGAFDQASAQYLAARRAVPSSPKIGRAIEACTKAIDDQRAREALLQGRLTVATEAATRADWHALLAIVKEIEELDPGNAAAVRWRLQAMKSLAAEQTHLPRDGVGRAQATTGSTASSSLPSVASPLEVPSRAISDAGDAERGGGEQLDERTQRVTRAARLRQKAEGHLASGDLVAAERAAAQSVSLNSEHTDTRHLLERTRAAIILQRKKDEKWRRVTELLQRADSLSDRKRYLKALALVDEALAIDATHVGAAAMRTRLSAEHGALEAGKAAEATRRQRLKAAAPALLQARQAFQQRDFVRARWCAESALALAPHSEDARALLAQIVAAIPAPAPSDDDTVTLDDPQSDTVEFVPLRPSMRDRITDLCAKASTWLRRRVAAATKDR